MGQRYRYREPCEGPSRTFRKWLIADELANLSPAEIEVLRFACDHDNPLVSKR